MEGIEITKQIRQTAVNRNRETGYASSIGSKEEGDYIIIRQGDGFSLQMDNNELIEMNEEPFIDYCRTINIAGDPKSSIRQISSTVRWGGVDCEMGENTITYSTFLANLAK